MQQTKSLERIALFAVMTTSFMVTFMGSSVNLAIPSMSVDYGSNAVVSSWIITAYLLSSAVFLLPLGRIADIKGRRRIYLLGTALYAVFTFLVPFSSTIEILITMRVLQGISAAMIFGTGMAILSAVYPPQRRGRALGFSVSVTYLGLSLGPVLGGMMNHYLGWQSIFYVTGLLGLIAVAVISTRLKGEWVGSPGERLDIPGSLLYMTGLLALLYGLSAVKTSPWSGYLILTGLIVMALFVYWESKISEPVLKIELFKNNLTFTMSNLAALINYSATFAVTFLLSIYLQLVRGYDSQTAGFILLAQPLVMAILSPLAGTLSDRAEPGKVASLGMACSALSLFFFIFLKTDTALILLIANLILAGLGFALFSSPNNNAIMGSVPMRLYGIASSILGTMRLVGQALSMSAVTLIIGIFIGQVSLNTAQPTAILTTMRVSFILFTVLCLLGIAASLARGNVHEETASAKE
ncbi:Tetracycline resistance protein TetB/drug resistance transporter [Syntrophomonas zehnderi OL-4]|uniref:Tetracycline resistance protein TetB/drug resistance transporter n=1 Tax=Syntrophomonas zehnderi OL-4 TaxID=690567 RepID=A0A0E4GBS8_9FIRM|nr:MFS transporter [Syntrophomonas zehnderi]CFW97028.1 Tetracycline resistance protein TetB/drug resistance transporter [Syntrophomonas zehnderi OL-4]